MKVQEKSEARRIRSEEGASILEIASRLGVSKSSVSIWVRDIELSEEQLRVLHGNSKNGALAGRIKGVEVIRERALRRRREYQDVGRGMVSDPVFCAGCMLYWGEGAKSRNTLKFANSDPDMMRFFKKFVDECFDVPVEKMKLYVNCYANPGEAESFWVGVLGLPRQRLGKTVLNTVSSYSKRKKEKNKLPYGTCHFVVNSTEVVQKVWGGIQEIGGFERGEWLF